MAINLRDYHKCKCYANQPALQIQRLYNAKQSIDCDASVILCGENGKLVSSNINDCCVYFGNLCHASGAIVHQTDKGIFNHAEMLFSGLFCQEAGIHRL